MAAEVYGEALGAGVDNDFIPADSAWLLASGEMARRGRVRAAHRIESILHAEINRRILAQMPAVAMQALVEEVLAFRLDPYTAADQLLTKSGPHLSIGT